MGRRQLLVIVSALAMVLIGGAVVGGLVTATQSDGGREWIRAQLSREFNRGLHGHVHLGRLSGTFLTDVTIDSLELRDPDDSVYIASGPVTLRFDPRDLADGRFLFRGVEAEHPIMVVRKELDDTWNFRKIFPVDETPSAQPPMRAARGAFGSLVVFRNIRLRGGEVRLTMPWTPADSLTGARRDSAIAFNLADASTDIRRASLRGIHGYQKTYRWKDIDGTISHFRFRHPDSTGREFDIARLDVNETAPPFRIRNLHGTALWRGDTVWFDVPRFSLPGSTAAASGKVEWPAVGTFWDVRLTSDSTALDDIRWITPSIPAVGHGSMRLHVKSRANPDIIDYAITDMDVHSRASRIRGAMTFGVGGAVLEVRNVNLSLEPADFVLLEALNTAPFPYPWRGTVRGRVQASGGPVNHFQVEHAALAFADANVPGATASGTGQGEVDILSPGLAKFHGFRVNVDHFDLRTPQFLNREFPRLNGEVSGTATLDSTWTDVRLSDADITHRDGDDSPPSRLRGEARVTLGDALVSFDATAAALPLSATTLAKSYPAIALRGDYRGPLRISGNVADFAFATDLTGDGGRVQVDGRFDALSPGYAAVARGSVSGFDFRRALQKDAAPTSSLDARFAIDVRGDSTGNLAGTAQLDVDRSIVDSVRVFGGTASLRLGDGLVHVDSLALETVAGSIRARGALGTVPSTTDTLSFQVVADSLGGLRRYLARGVSDSLEGVLRGSGVLTGRVSHFALDAGLTGTGLLFRATEARELRGTVALSALPDSATGSVTLRVDGVRSGSLAISSGELRADLLGGWQARTTARVTAPSGVEARLLADVRRHADTTTVRLDSLSAQTASNTWRLQRPTTVVTTGSGFGFDTLVLAGERGGRIAAAGRTSSLDTIAVALRADAVPLADLGQLLQARQPMQGTVTLRADVRGTRARPDLFFTGTLDSATLGGLPLGRVEADGRYSNRRLTTAVALARAGVAAVHADASMPLDLALEPAGSRFLEEPLVAHIRTDTAGLGLVESLLPSVSHATGALRMDVDVSGTWRHPRFTGSVSVADGALSLEPMGSVRLEGVEADIGLLGDSIAIRRLAARSGADRTKTAQVVGGISLRDVTDPTFALQADAHGFNVLNDPRLADLDLTGNLRLTGRRSAAALTGGFTVDRGVIRLPELYQKRVISLDDPNLFRVVDTTALANRQLLTAGDSLLMNNLAVRNVQIRMGQDVWLRSDEANINLGGSVSVTRTRIVNGPSAGRWQLALEGPLQTVRGTYRLSLGPVQRTFTVENGDVRFYGDPDLNATLNINALHVVRQVSQQGARPDVRVRVHIGGTRLSPTAELSSPDSARVSAADLVSYLATGGPSTAISGPSTDYGSAAYRFALSTVGTYLGGKASGGICDDVQLSTAGLYGGELRSVGSQVLQGTRFNCAKQVTDRIFLRLDAGLCQVGRLVDPGASGTSQGNIQNAFGVKLDYRLTPEMTVSAGVEPPTSAVYCRDDAGARGFAPTPQQFGLDLFRLWRF